jgi:excisionase family DNA binding protein
MTTTTTRHRVELTVAEAAAELGVTPGHIRMLISTGKLKAHKRGQRENHILRTDLDRYNQPENRVPGVRPLDRTPRRYGKRWDHLFPPTPPPDPLREDVRALLEAYRAGERDVDDTTTAVILRVLEERR